MWAKFIFFIIISFFVQSHAYAQGSEYEVRCEQLKSEMNNTCNPETVKNKSEAASQETVESQDSSESSADLISKTRSSIEGSNSGNDESLKQCETARNKWESLGCASLAGGSEALEKNEQDIEKIKGTSEDQDGQVAGQKGVNEKADKSLNNTTSDLRSDPGFKSGPMEEVVNENGHLEYRPKQMEEFINDDGHLDYRPVQNAKQQTGHTTQAADEYVDPNTGYMQNKDNRSQIAITPLDPKTHQPIGETMHYEAFDTPSGRVFGDLKGNYTTDTPLESNPTTGYNPYARPTSYTTQQPDEFVNPNTGYMENYGGSQPSYSPPAATPQPQAALGGGSPATTPQPQSALGGGSTAATPQPQSALGGGSTATTPQPQAAPTNNVASGGGFPANNKYGEAAPPSAFGGTAVPMPAGIAQAAAGTPSNQVAPTAQNFAAAQAVPTAQNFAAAQAQASNQYLAAQRAQLAQLASATNSPAEEQIKDAIKKQNDYNGEKYAAISPDKYSSRSAFGDFEGNDEFNNYDEECREDEECEDEEFENPGLITKAVSGFKSLFGIGNSNDDDEEEEDEYLPTPKQRNVAAVEQQEEYDEYEALRKKQEQEHFLRMQSMEHEYMRQKLASAGISQDGIQKAEQLGLENAELVKALDIDNSHSDNDSVEYKEKAMFEQSEAFLAYDIDRAHLYKNFDAQKNTRQPAAKKASGKGNILVPTLMDRPNQFGLN